MCFVHFLGFLTLKSGFNSFLTNSFFFLQTNFLNDKRIFRLFKHTPKQTLKPYSVCLPLEPTISYGEGDANNSIVGISVRVFIKGVNASGY